VKRRRIVLLIPQLGYGGAESAFLRLARYLSRHVEVTIALMARDYGTDDYSSPASNIDLPVVLLDENRVAASGFSGKLFRWWRMRRRYRKLKRDHHVSISFLSGANLLNVLAGASCKTIVSERGSKRFDSGMAPAQRWIWTRILDRFVYYRAGAIVAASEGLASEIVGSFSTVRRKLLAIEGTVRSEELWALRESIVGSEYQVFKSYFTVVAIGRCHVQKGFDVLIEALAIIRRSRSDVRLLLLGDGPEIKSLQARGHELGLRAGYTAEPDKFDVVFAGFQPNPARFLQFARAFVMPSRYEGLPNVLIEALAFPVRILAADCPWGPRSILAGPGEQLPQCMPVPGANRLTYGTLMPVPDQVDAPSIWAEEIVALIASSTPRTTDEARRQAIERFDIERTGPKWLELAERVAVGH